MVQVYGGESESQVQKLVTLLCGSPVLEEGPCALKRGEKRKLQDDGNEAAAKATIRERLHLASTPLRSAERRVACAAVAIPKIDTKADAEPLAAQEECARDTAVLPIAEAFEERDEYKGVVIPRTFISAKEDSACKKDRDDIELAFSLFRAFLADYVRARQQGPEETWSKRACAHAEQRMIERYEEIRDLVAQLLQGLVATDEASEELVGEGESAYSLIRLRGHNSKPRSRKQLKDMDDDDLECELARGSKMRSALCAALAVLTARREMCWFEAFDGAQSSTERRYPQAFFTPKLVDRSAVFRISLAPGLPLRPASLIVTYLATLGEALSEMDDGGPLKLGQYGRAGRQFAFQDIWPGDDERAPARLLRPEPKLRELLCSSSQVLVLDTYAALAPRDEAKTHGLNPIIRAELAVLLQEAKARKRAVVFACGGEDPHMLAEKVYMRPPFNSHGLRCGYIRWRDSPRAPWAREKPWGSRVCIGLQMP